MNRKIRIGLSLLIALSFILPAGGILAEQDSKVVNAVENEITTSTTSDDVIYIGDDVTGQDPGDVSVLGLINPELGGPSGNAIREGTYPITVDLFNDPGQGPAEVKAFVDIYEKQEGERITMYETSFEDNFDIYNNWIQIDEDCGTVGGQFDSWTVSDARSADGDYSFKCSQYDVYKGNQDDYLEMQEGLDVSDQAAVEVNFKIWVDGSGQEGDYGFLEPYDYLDFEIGSDWGEWLNPMAPNADMLFLNWNPDVYPTRWLNLTQFNWFTPDNDLGVIYPFLDGMYYFYDTSMGLYNFQPSNDYTPFCEDLGGGWWQVTYRVPVNDLPQLIDPTSFKMRFSWTSDPEYQYEGAYVDDVEIISIENFEHKVFQSHSQGPFTIPEGHSEYTFPMEWTATGDEGKDTCYDIRLWLEVLDSDHTSTNDWPDYLDVMVCVTDWFDTEVDNLVVETSVGSEPIIPGSGILEFGEDAHIIADVHLDGTLPSEDIPVTATARKLTWETLFESDCEGLNPFPDTYGNVQLTDRDAYSGSTSLGFFNDDTFEYELGAFSYALGPSINMKDKTEVYWDFAWKAMTAPGDVVRPCLLDNYHNYVLGAGVTLGGYQPEWVSPTEPASVYQRVDMVELVDYFKGQGFLHDRNGDEIFDIGIGYYFSENGDGVNKHPLAADNGIYWSGVFIDDIKITAESVGEEIWSQTVIIPGPVEPCETTEVQFEWEDVPECNYQLCVESHPDGACGNLNNPRECAELLVVQDLEAIHPKEVESIDYTGEQNGEWGISSSDYENYIATNADSLLYPANANNVLQLCPGGERCIDVSALDIEYEYPVYFADEFADLSAWTQDEGEFLAHNGNLAGGDPPEARVGAGRMGSLDTNGYAYIRASGIDTSTADELTLEFKEHIDVSEGSSLTFITWINDGTGWYKLEERAIENETITASRSFDIIDNTSANLRIQFAVYDFDSGEQFVYTVDDVMIHGVEYPPDRFFMNMDVWYELEFDYDFVWVEIAECTAETYLDWTIIDAFNGASFLEFPNVDDDGFTDYMLELSRYVDLLAPSGMFELRLRLDSDAFTNWRGMKIRSVDIPAIGFSDDANTLANWCQYPYSIGNFWTEGGPGQWCASFPSDMVDNALIWETEIEDAYEAYLNWETDHNFTSGSGLVQVSADGGENWYTVREYTGADESGDFDGIYEFEEYTMNHLVGNKILVRFLGQGTGDWCIRNVSIVGKKDMTAPVTDVKLSGTMADGWYMTPVTVTITATDEGAGMGEIHYILDGQETVVAGDEVTFTVSENGEHNLEFWGVDKTGNEELPHNTIPTFKIDAGSPPSVAITAPEPGLYLFGNKLLSLSKVFIVGAFTAEATASDAESGVYRVQFLLDGDLVAEDTEAPYSAYIAEKHMGAGTLKVVAEDFSGNTAEDSLDITYYKFL